MVEITKQDYLSLVNQGGSGFDVSSIVESIVASEIEPKRNLQNQKLEKTENSISGIGFLYAQCNTTQSNFQTIEASNYFDINSSNPSGVSLIPTDEAKLNQEIRSISDVTVARKMVFELAGFSSVSDALEPGGAAIDIDFGTWTEINSDNFSFAAAADNVTQNISFAGKSLTQVAALFEAVPGITAQIVDTLGDGTSFSLILQSEATGAETGFKLTEASNNTRWETTSIPSSTTDNNNFTQLATDANFKLDGVQVTRQDNIITDVIDGASIHLKSDFSASASLVVGRSKETIKQSLADIVFLLNQFREEINRLTYIDVDGDENGPLAMEPAATLLKSNFKKLAVEPIYGYGSSPIFLSQLGIKTNSSGEYFLDEYTFDQTFVQNPEYFSALKDEKISSDNLTAIVSKSEFTNIPAGTYEITEDSTSGDWMFGETVLTRVDADNGGSIFTSATYPGLLIQTLDRNPSDFNVYVGTSFSKKVIELMSDTVGLSSSFKSVEDSYRTLKVDIGERLSKLEERENLISSRYTEQFGRMEQAMTKFNSTKTMLENFIKSWENK